MLLSDPGNTKRALVDFPHAGMKACIVLSALLTLSAAAAAFAGNNVTYEMEKVTPYEFRGDVRELSRAPLAASTQRRPYLHPIRKLAGTKKAAAPFYEPAFPSLNITVPLAPMPGPIQNFGGMNFSDTCTGGQCGAGWPPDPNGDVGLTHYIQAVNDAYAVYNKTGTLLAAFTENSLWSSVSSTIPCNGNSSGDPIVLYDQQADRWILSHFAFATISGTPVSPFYQCIAVSKTNDPVSGGWWLYPLRMDPDGTGKPPTGTFNDYTKLGIWTGCLYLSANGFAEPGGNYAGQSFASLSLSDLESGAPLSWSLGFLDNTNDAFTMIPSNLSGAGALPPPGTPNYFVSESQTGLAYEVRKFSPGPNCGTGGTLSAPVQVNHASYPLPGTNTNLVPQRGTTNTLDIVDNRLMQKVQYRNISGVESLWVVHNVPTATGLVALQWSQIDVTGGAIAATPVQQQIYAPDTALYRWMGSLAVDKKGNMALGYSTSSTTQFPSIAYSGRLATDPLNTLPQAEVQLVAGAGSQTNNCGGAICQRWGDYSAMSVDPVDDCTFWYTNQYYSSQTNGTNGNWQTRIGSFKFPLLVATAVLTSITPTSATGGGNVTSEGCAPVTHRGVCWGTSANPTIADSCTDDGAGPGVFTSSITGLTSGITYHVRAYATDLDGTTGYGNDVSFIPGMPFVTTTAIIGITNTSATGGGDVLSDGGSTVTARGVCWSTSANPTIADSHTVDGAGLGIFASSITGLTPGAAYHVRAYATNSLGTAYGNDVSYAPGAPSVTTTAITGITKTSATGGGEVTSDGGAAVTARGVCWNTTGNPTMTDSCTHDGAGSGVFTSSLAGLTPGTVYQVRAYAANFVGTAYGDNVAFTTPAKRILPPAGLTVH